MPLLSILTAARAPTATHLAQTVASVRRQVLPAGWDLEWVVQDDGPAPGVRDRFDGLPYVRYAANGTRLGVAPTRNLGLARVRGGLVQVLDHDDVLLPGALATLVAAVVEHRVHWAVGQADDLFPDGRRPPYPSALPYGVVPARGVNDWALANGGNWPVHCAGLLMRTATLRAVGGWAGLPVDDDVAMLAALSEVADGYNEPTVTWLYRHHPDQTGRSGAWRTRGDEGRRVAVQRIAAIRAAGLRLGPATGLPEPDDVAVGPLHPEKERRRGLL